MIKAAIERNEAVRKKVLGAKERCLEFYKEEKGKLKRFIYPREE